MRCMTVYLFFYGICMSNLSLLQQEDVVKVTEKCGLSSTGSSPNVTPLRTPEDLKSNILKAQAEAAALKVRSTLWELNRKKRERRSGCSYSTWIRFNNFWGGVLIFFLGIPMSKYFEQAISWCRLFPPLMLLIVLGNWDQYTFLWISNSAAQLI